MTYSGGPYYELDLVSDRIAVTFVCLDACGSARVTSYVNTTGGTWTLVRGSNSPADTVRVTLHLVPGRNRRVQILLPYGQTGPWLDAANSATAFTYVCDATQLESCGKLSIYAAQQSDSGCACGRVVNQPFQRGDTNAGTVDLNKPDPILSITSSLPIGHLELHALRDSARSDYLMFSDTCMDTLLRELPISYFPASRWRVVGFGDSGDGSYNFEQTGMDPALMPNIPTATASARYDPDSGMVKDVSVYGAADAIGASYLFTSDQTESVFEVYAPVASPTPALPVLRDSLLAAIHRPEQSLWAVGLDMYDYDTASGYDDYIGIVSRAPCDQPGRYTTLYSTERLLYSGPLQPSSLLPPAWLKAHPALLHP